MTTFRPSKERRRRLRRQKRPLVPRDYRRPEIAPGIVYLFGFSGTSALFVFHGLQVVNVNMQQMKSLLWIEGGLAAFFFFLLIAHLRANDVARRLQNAKSGPHLVVTPAMVPEQILGYMSGCHARVHLSTGAVFDVRTEHQLTVSNSQLMIELRNQHGTLCISIPIEKMSIIEQLRPELPFDSSDIESSGRTPPARGVKSAIGPSDSAS